jgi:hypothetical protein
VAESQREAFRTAARAGNQWNSDNTAVNNLLVLALADGPARIYTDKHPGDGAKVFAVLRGMFASKEKVTMCAAQTTNKWKALKYTGAPNFTWGPIQPRTREALH